MADQQQGQDQGGGSWFPWVLGAGAVAAVGVAVGAAYLGYRALPYALAFGDPEAADKFEAWRRAAPAERRELALGFARDLGADARGESKPLRRSSATLPRIEQWKWKMDPYGERMLVGHVYGHPSAPDGEPIETYPKRVDGDVAVTERSKYRLGEPARA